MTCSVSFSSGFQYPPGCCRTPRSRPPKATVYKSQFPPLRHFSKRHHRDSLYHRATINHVLYFKLMQSLCHYCSTTGVFFFGILSLIRATGVQILPKGSKLLTLAPVCLYGWNKRAAFNLLHGLKKKC